MYKLKTEITKEVAFASLSTYLCLKVLVDIFLLMADFSLFRLLFNFILYFVMCVCIYQAFKASIRVKKAEKQLSVSKVRKNRR